MPKENDPPSEAPPSSRMDASLFLLTKKFLALINQSTNKKIDLNFAATKLNVHKRRIYDITNILEGMKMLQKISVNIAQWIGEDINLILTSLDEDGDLENHNEDDLDDKLRELNSELNSLVLDAENAKYLYVNFKELSNLKALKNKTIFAIKAPHDSYFETSEEAGKNILQLNSTDGKIDVYYIEEKKK